ncbi:hypothetical protein GE061_009935 [Apolygus lucorum]|uniref:Uncharacterized protein n=1 Tax=Apolygus lucorum TaxID=248454 RepID=A0A8S9Y1W8_APOLU|nr:hypothetical protein GE061_009935 [Apolygus lucorum]
MMPGLLGFSLDCPNCKGKFEGAGIWSEGRHFIKSSFTCDGKNGTGNLVVEVGVLPSNKGEVEGLKSLNYEFLNILGLFIASLPCLEMDMEMVVRSSVFI